MRVGWQNWRSAPIGMGMVNCDYRVYTPLGWSNRMNGMDIIARQRVVISLGHANRWFVCDDYIVGNLSN
jgi:hypothetical protein